MQLGQIQPKKIEASQLNAEKAEDAFEKGLRFPWMGLRPDLLLHKGAPDESGKETYVLEDPVRGEHFELGESEAKLFLCLAAEKDLKAAVDRLMKTSSLRPGAKDVLGGSSRRCGYELRVRTQAGTGGRGKKRKEKTGTDCDLFY